MAEKEIKTQPDINKAEGLVETRRGKFGHLKMCLIEGGMWNAWMDKPYYVPFCDRCGRRLLEKDFNDYEFYTTDVKYYKSLYWRCSNTPAHPRRTETKK